MDPLPTFEPAKESPSGDASVAARFPLILMTPKTALHFLNSSYANLPRHLRAEPEPRLYIHPDDAAARVADRVRPGDIAIPFGWWKAHAPSALSPTSLPPTASAASAAATGTTRCLR